MTQTVKIIKNLTVCCAVAAAMSLLVGCAAVHKLPLQEIAFVQEQVDSMHNDVIARYAELLAEQNKLLAEQNKLLEEQKTNAEMLRLLRADQSMRFNEIDRKVSAIESNVSESQSKLARLDQQTATVGRRLEERIAQEDEVASARKLQLEKLFEIAMGDFNAGRYDLAIGGFRDFMKQFPEAPQTIEAEYWIAESYYAKKEYETAEKEYFEFVKKHANPPHERYCVSLYKLGLAYEHQEKTKSRDMVWKNLVDRCGNSPEAQRVKEEQKKQ